MRWCFAFLLVVFGVGAGCSSVREKRCVEAQIRLWAAARAYAAECSITENTLISPAELVPYLSLAGSTNDLMCPVTGVPYPPFTVKDGPTCPSGHMVRAEDLPWHTKQGD